MKTAFYPRVQQSNQSSSEVYDSSQEIKNFFEIKVHPSLLMPCFNTFSLNAPCKFAQILNMRLLIFGLTPSVLFEPFSPPPTKGTMTRTIEKPKKKSDTKRNNRCSNLYGCNIYDLWIINDCVIQPVKVNLIIRDNNNMEHAPSVTSVHKLFTIIFKLHKLKLILFYYFCINNSNTNDNNS